MPFWYLIPVPALSEPGAQIVRLVQWLVQDGEEFHAGTRLAIVETAANRFVVLANGDGFVRERLCPEGARLKPGAPLARADADSENIPYGRPYSTAEWTGSGK